jgi:hypothetical protein
MKQASVIRALIKGRGIVLNAMPRLQLKLFSASVRLEITNCDSNQFRLAGGAKFLEFNFEEVFILSEVECI